MGVRTKFKREMETKMKPILKRELKFLGPMMKKEGLENMIPTGKISNKRDRGKQCIKF